MGKTCFEVYTIEWTFPAKLVNLTKISQFLHKMTDVINMRAVFCVLFRVAGIQYAMV